MTTYSVVSGPTKEDIDDFFECGPSFDKALKRWQYNKQRGTVLNRIVIENGDQSFWIDDIVEVSS